MIAFSLLFESAKAEHETRPEAAPTILRDLNLDQIVDGITAGRGELKGLFHTPLRDVETIRYRQEVMRDLEAETLLECVKTFSGKMVAVRRGLVFAERRHFDYHGQGWVLESALVYCDAITELAQGLEGAHLESRGLVALRDFVKGYVRSERFQSLRKEAQSVRRGLTHITYGVIIENGRFSVRKYEGESDYTVEVESAFEKFQQGGVKDYRAKLNPLGGMNHVEAQILEFVARLYPGEFAALDRFCGGHRGFADETILSCEQEIQFYVAYLDFIAGIQRSGLPFCYPRVSRAGRRTFARDSFDLALAHKLVPAGREVILNDFRLEPPERIIVVSGPNQGGKTTFARMFGQLHYLASLGCPVPARAAELSLFDQIYTHFERQEDIRNLRGKLQDDLIRIRDILAQASSTSILIVNELFASTALDDAIFLSRTLQERLLERGLLCVWVTFIDEVASMGGKTISMVSTVDPENPEVRTFKIVRRPADGLAYALAIARKHRLTYEQVKERMKT